MKPETAIAFAAGNKTEVAGSHSISVSVDTARLAVILKVLKIPIAVRFKHTLVNSL